MANPDLTAEIREIKAQLESLNQQRTGENASAKSRAGAAQEKPGPDTVADADVVDDASVDEASLEDLTALKSLLAEFDAEDAIDSLSTHAREWLGSLNEDLKHTKASTLLTVFGLGVIVGRLTK